MLARVSRFSLFLIGVVLVCVYGHSGEAQGKDFNAVEYELLCTVLSAAVAKYNEKGSNSVLQQALERTIFGKSGVSGKTLNGLALPEDYKIPGKQESKDTRRYWCGLCDGEKHTGISAPHDLLCLCTPGQLGYPLIGADDTDDTLCGKKKSIWGVKGSKHGWYTDFSGNDQGKEHLNKTWDEIVLKCMQGGNSNNLEKYLNLFIAEVKKVVNKPLGEHGSGSDCDGIPSYGVCIFYRTECEHKSWWNELKEAIEKDKENRQKEDAERKEYGTAEMEKSKTLRGPQTAPERSDQITQHISRVSLSPQTEERDSSLIAEKLISNATPTHDEEGSIIIMPQWLLLAALLF